MRSLITMILTGWYSLLFKEATFKVKKRLATCNKCPFKSWTNFCKDCGCYIPAKCFSELSECKYWKDGEK